MYKVLLAWRYLRTRYIALASIVSVTLGVATLVIVNSVMAGFTQEMEKRLNGILSDIVFESQSHSGVPDAERYMAEIRQVVGDDLAGITAAVHVPAMVVFRVGDRYLRRPFDARHHHQPRHTACVANRINRGIGEQLPFSCAR